MTCIRCQAIEAAKANGTEQAVADELARQLVALAKDTVPRAEHERVVAALNKEIVRLRRRRRDD